MSDGKKHLFCIENPRWPTIWCALEIENCIDLENWFDPIKTLVVITLLAGI
jgi:hypothetical protein